VIDLKPLSLRDAIQIYVLANTPSYLLRKLRSEPSVKSFAEANTAEGLLNTVKKINRKRVRSLKAVSLAYASLVAMTFKKPEDLQTLLSYRPKNLVWLSKILSLHEHRRVSSTSINLVVLALFAIRGPPRIGTLITNWDFPI